MINDSDVNECESGEHDCDTNAECMNTEGNYGCACRKGYAGNGTVCISKLDTTLQSLLSIWCDGF